MRYPVLGRELPEIIREDPVTLEEFNTLLGQKLDKGIGQNANFISSNSVYSVINRQAAYLVFYIVLTSRRSKGENIQRRCHGRGKAPGLATYFRGY